MTVQQMLINIHEQSGQDPAIAPYTYDPNGEGTFDITTAGAVRLLEYVNRAYLRLCNWRFNDGSILRFKELIKNKKFRYTERSVVVSSNVGRTIVASSTGVFSLVEIGANLIENLYVLISGLPYLIESYTISSADTISFTLANTPSFADASLVGTTVKLASREILIYPTSVINTYVPGASLITDSDNVASILEVTDITNSSTDLPRAEAMLRFIIDPAELVAPTLFKPTRLGFEFNTIPVTDTLYSVRYYAEPEVLSLAADEPNISTPWHDVIWMIAANMRLLEEKAHESASTLWSVIVATINSLVKPDERKYDLQETYVTTRS